MLFVESLNQVMMFLTLVTCLYFNITILWMMWWPYFIECNQWRYIFFPRYVPTNVNSIILSNIYNKIIQKVSNIATHFSRFNNNSLHYSKEVYHSYNIYIIPLFARNKLDLLLIMPFLEYLFDCDVSFFNKLLSIKVVLKIIK